VFIGIQIAPTANLLTVIKGVRDAFPEISRSCRRAWTARIVYDSTDFVNASIHEVAVT
jgi:multidrug efflux pump